MKAVAYIRVSQEDENPENQRFIIGNYCKEHNLECIFFPEIGVSRVEDPFKRPVFSQVLQFMEWNNVRTLIVESIDRLTAVPEHWDKLITYFAEKSIRLVAVRDEDITEAFSNVIRTLESLKGQVRSEVLKVVIDSQVESLKRQIRLYQKIKVAVAKEYVEDVRYKTRRALARIKNEGRLYHRPTLLHYLAAYIKHRERLGDVTTEDLRDAAKYFLGYVEPLLREGVPKRRAWRRFLERHSQLYRAYPQAPRSYQAFMEALRRARALIEEEPRREKPS